MPRAAAGGALALALLVALALSQGWLLGSDGDTSDRSLIPGLRLVGLPAGYRSAAWSPNGRWLATSARYGLELREADDNGSKRLQAPALNGALGPAARIEWSPDGKRLRYLTIAGPAHSGTLKATEVAREGGLSHQASLGTSLAYGAWSPHGWPLFFVTGRYELGVDGSPEGPAPALWMLAGIDAKPRLLTRLRGFPERPQVSPDGRRIAYVDHLKHRTGLWTIDADGSHPRQLARFLLVARDDWSPDGRRIAFSALRRRGGGLHLFVVGVDGGSPKQIGDEEVLDGPTWSPDGRWLTFSTPGGAIRRIHPNGRHAETIAEFPGKEVRGLLWSPDSRHLAYIAVTPDESSG